MLYNYCTITEDELITEVGFTPICDGSTTVHIEKADSVFGFKQMDCVIPGYNVSSVVGFNESEVADLVQFCMDNAALIMMGAMNGGEF